jgi:hypothetical protein
MIRNLVFTHFGSRIQCPTCNGTKKFNTKIDVGLAISVTWQHKVLLEYVAQENHTLTFATLSAEQKQAVREDAEEWYISYAFSPDEIRIYTRDCFRESQNPNLGQCASQSFSPDKDSLI